MKEVKFIQGDLVTNRLGKALRIVDMVEGMLYTEYQDGSTGLYISRKDVVPIQLTSNILESNGWKLARQGIDDEKFEYFEYEKGYEYPVLIFYPCKGGQNMSLSVYIKGKLIVDFIQYCHQLQHLLFGLRLNPELKV